MRMSEPKVEVLELVEADAMEDSDDDNLSNVVIGDQVDFDTTHDDLWTMWNATSLNFDTIFSSLRGLAENLNKINQMIENGELGGGTESSPPTGGCCCCQNYQPQPPQ